MILELADIRIQPGQQAAFEVAIERGARTVQLNLAQGAPFQMATGECGAEMRPRTRRIPIGQCGIARLCP